MIFRALRKEDWPWVKARAAPILCEDTKGIIAEDKNGAILAAAVFDSWSHTSCHVHIAMDNVMVIRHGFLEEIKNYVFNTAGRKIMLGVTPSNNLRALKFNRHAGMVEIFRIEDGYDHGVDYVVTRMTKEEWLNARQSSNSRRSRAAA